MEEQWFIAPDGARQGPLSRDELQLALNEGRLDRDTLVWRQGMDVWQPLEAVEELQSLLELLPPPLPETPPPLPEEPPPLPPPLPPAPPASAPDAEAPTPPPAPERGLTLQPQFSAEISLTKNAPPPEAPRAKSGSGKEEEKKEEKKEEKREEKKGEGREERRGGPAKRPKSIVRYILKVLFLRRIWELLVGLMDERPAIAWSLLVSVTISVAVGVWCIFGGCTKEDPPNAERSGQVQIDANPWGEVQWIRDEEGSEMILTGERTTPFSISLPEGTYESKVSYPPSGATQQCALVVREGKPAKCWLNLAPVDADAYFKAIGW